LSADGFTLPPATQLNSIDFLISMDII
jgi:hypothetical protein